QVVVVPGVPAPARWWGAGQRPWYYGYLVSACAVFTAAAVIRLIQAFFDLSNLRLVMLAAVLYSATAFGLGPAIFASLLSVVIYDYFFVDPNLTFSATEPEDALTTAIFIAVAI